MTVLALRGSGPAAYPSRPHSGPDRPYAAVLADLPAVGLDVLAEHAERMTRVDRKYLVPESALDRVIDAVCEDAVALDIDDRRTFGYVSTYYDTADRRSYHDGGRSRRRRFKVRTRCYVDSGLAFLEVKTRGPRGTTVKTRTELTRLPGPELNEGSLAFVDSTLRAHGVTDVSVEGLRPVLEVDYRRSTLAFLSVGARATVDTDLCWRGLDGRSVRLPGVAILETKAGSTPTGVDRALWRLGHRPARLSKYGAGLAVTDASLPHLKWHRILTDPLLAVAG